ncbi:hypothetical protein A4A49_63301, partial [Nicotiana attenuata]
MGRGRPKRNASKMQLAEFVGASSSSGGQNKVSSPMETLNADKGKGRMIPSLTGSDVTKLNPPAVVSNSSSSTQNLTPTATIGKIGALKPGSTTVPLVNVAGSAAKENQLTSSKLGATVPLVTVAGLGATVPLVTVAGSAAKENQFSPSMLGASTSKQNEEKETKQEKNEGKLEKPWVNLFAGNRLAERGMDLVCNPPLIQDGVKKVQLQQEEMEEENEK